QRGLLRVHLRRLSTLRDVLGLKAADVVAGRRIRRAAQKLGKGFDVPDIIVRGLGAEVAVRHILQHAPAQIGDGLLGHRGLPSRGWSDLTPRSSRRSRCSVTDLASLGYNAGANLSRLAPHPPARAGSFPDSKATSFNRKASCAGYPGIALSRTSGSSTHCAGLLDHGFLETII